MKHTCYIDTRRTMKISNPSTSPFRKGGLGDFQVKNIVISILILIFLVSLIACAGTEPKGKSMSDDLGSAEKVALLRERANEFWSAFVKRDYERVYEIYDPFFQSRTAKSSFVGQSGALLYHDFEVKDIKVEGNVAKVTVKVVYSMPNFTVKMQEFKVPESTTEFEEPWLYVYDNWFKEYYLQSIEAGVAKY